MNEEVFKQNAFIPYLIAVVFVIGTFLIFIFTKDAGLKIFIPLVIPVVFLLEPLLTKVLINEDEIHYNTLSGDKNVVSLHDVSRMVIREEDSIEESRNSDGNYERRRISQRFVYLLDRENHVYFKFPEKYVKGKNWSRFKNAVQRINSAIEID